MTASQGRQLFYADASVAGLILTAYFNITYRGSRRYLAAWFANSASTSAACDLIILAAAVSVFMVAEGRRLQLRLPVLYVVVGCALAMAFAVPLFLLLRERALRRESGQGTPQ